MKNGARAARRPTVALATIPGRGRTSALRRGPNGAHARTWPVARHPATSTHGDQLGCLVRDVDGTLRRLNLTVRIDEFTPTIAGYDVR